MKITRIVRTMIIIGFYLIAAGGVGQLAVAAELPIKSGQKLAFLGDSITQGGMGPSGFCTLVIAGLKANGIDVTPIGAGHSGDTSANMVVRVDPDVIDKKPEWMTLSCGVNDVNNPRFGEPLGNFKLNVVKIVSKAQAAGIQVMILTATPNTENLDSDKNQKLAQYNAFLRALAVEKHCLLADVNADFQQVIKENKDQDSHSLNPGHFLLADALHPNFERGNPVMARGLLRAFGLDDAQMARAEEAWLDLPRPTVLGASLSIKTSMSIRQQKLLKVVAERHHMNGEQIVQALLVGEVAGLSPAADSAELEKACEAETYTANVARINDRLMARLNVLLAEKKPAP